MGELLIEDKQIVVPGEKIASGDDIIPGFGTYRIDNDLYCSRLGILHANKTSVKVVPLSGTYMPREGDQIIARVTDVLMSGWRVDLGITYQAVLPVKDASSRFIEKGEDLTRIADIDEYIFVKVTTVTTQKLIDVSMKGPGLRRLDGGRVIRVNAQKVPRLIGKQGSMVQLIKERTGCQVLVGQNGFVWIRGEPVQEALANKIIKYIEEHAHTQGLTDKVKSLFDELGAKAPAAAKKAEKSEEKDE